MGFHYLGNAIIINIEDVAVDFLILRKLRQKNGEKSLNVRVFLCREGGKRADETLDGR